MDIYNNAKESKKDEFDPLLLSKGYDFNENVSINKAKSHEIYDLIILSWKRFMDQILSK